MEAAERPTKMPRLDTGEDEKTPTEVPQHSEAIAASAAPSAPAPSSNAEPPSPPLFTSSAPSTPPRTKTALKKLRRREEWEAKREERKIVRKEKKAAKRERVREQRQEAANQAGSDAHGQAPAMPGAHRKKRRKAHAIPLPVALVLDCGFDELMSEKEIISLSSQITRCYADMSMARGRAAKLVVAGFDGQLKDRFDTILQGHYRNWRGVEVYEEPLSEALKSISFSRESIERGRTEGIWSDADLEIPAISESQPNDAIPSKDTIYLTADSPNTLNTLQPYTTYIIGALVDRNRHKNICLKRAEELGIRTAKLPIAEYLEMRVRKILATNHVIEIMLGWLEDQDWGKALLRGVPARTGFVARTQDGEADQDENGEEGDGINDQRRANEGENRHENQGQDAVTAGTSLEPNANVQ